MSDGLDDPVRLDALERSGLLDSPPEAVFDHLTALARRILPVPVALFSLVDDQRQFFKSADGLPDPLAQERGTGLSHSFCQHVVTTAQALVVTDAGSDARVAGNLAIDDLSVRAYAGMPVRDPDGYVLGSFCAIDTVPRTWTEAELELLRDLAATAEAIIADRAAAAERLQARPDAGDLGQALRFNRRLQRALLPRPAGPELAGRTATTYQPGSDRLLLGGDFCDVHEHPDGTLGFVLGDVCGHGPESAAYAIALRAAWAALEPERMDVGELSGRLNAFAVRAQRSDTLLFATAVLGRLTPDGPGSRAVRAGHAQPVELTTPAAELDLPGGVPLGITTQASWTAGDLEVPEEGLLLFTDGLTEGRVAPGAVERWGTKRLLAALEGHRRAGATARDLAPLLIRDATAAHGAALPDDVAALWLRR